MKSQQTLQNLKKSAVAGAVAVALFAPNAFAQGGNTNNITAQSLSFQLTSPQDFVIDETQVFAYDREEAGTHFETVVTGPVVTCMPSSRPLCGTANQPATPPAPPELASKLNPILDSNKCMFFNGGALSDADPENPYLQSVQVSLGSGQTRVNWVFTWTYTIQVVGGLGVPPLTAWDLVETTFAGELPVEVSGSLAGQSTLTRPNAKQNQSKFKTSHTIMGPGGPRLQNGKIELFHLPDTANPIGSIDLDFSTNFSVTSGENFYYQTTLGLIFNSPPGLLVLEGFVDDIQNGLVSANGFLNNSSVFDDFAGNDNTGGERIVFGTEDPAAAGPLPLLDAEGNPVTLTEEGNYRLVLSGDLKGNTGEADANFSGSKNLSVFGEGCSTP